MTYTIERVTEFDGDIKKFLLEEAQSINNLFENKFDIQFADFKLMFEKGVFLVCRRDGKIRGIHLSFLHSSIFDKNTKSLYQQLFYVKPYSGRAAYHLFKKFIDIGRNEANHIITMLTSQTNIKSSTLESFGFKELETLYRLEV